MNSLTIDLEALHHNIQAIDGWVTSQDASWTLVTKVLCGHRETLQALQAIGIRSMADSRLGNLEAIDGLEGEVETWYLRLPHLPKVRDIVRLTDVSLNSEIEVVEALSAEAVRQGRRHSIIIMVELGDLREGVLPGSLLPFFEKVVGLPNLDISGIGSN
ncbi:MAG: alanine racemase, partial [Planctomycetes bacterium]|nr:alanine racemase [Planctomycetota bacterium]